MKPTILSRLHRLEARASDVPAAPLVIIRVFVDCDGTEIEPISLADALGHSWERCADETYEAFEARAVVEARAHAAFGAAILYPSEAFR